MRQSNNKTSKIMIFGVILGDLILMNGLFTLMYHLWPHISSSSIFSGGYWEMMAFNTLCYVASTYYNGVILHLRKSRNMNIISKVTENCIKFITISVSFIALAGYEALSTRFLIIFHLLNYFVLIIWRISCHQIVRKFRSKGRNTSFCIYLGSGSSIKELYGEQSLRNTGYRVLGYFNDSPDNDMPTELTYLGKPETAIVYLENHTVNNIYCSLPSEKSELILEIIHWSEQNFAHFFHVPHVRNYLQHRMWFDTVGDVPVLSLHREPLNEFDNRIIKRAFDFLASGIFLCTVFPFIYLIVGAIIKITSPGPIFFKQKRNGINGKEFWCYKFRSMKVNKDADKIQATKNDPRKTKFGDFMRKTNIDELPQLINVFLGDMSLVGPRPHMLKHTEEYSKLIDNYMVRHFVKPGITGWAQVTGYRGETKELHQMEGRVKADIWYMEHWSFLLDLHIIYKTFANVIIGEKNAY
ncbi:MAG: undecaprenyl-phosphate glucose phosphotransferase [Bacteroides sp]|nr:undecaprenyl-phosphate glucose phosphotransferase [Bacteroides sp.]